MNIQTAYEEGPRLDDRKKIHEITFIINLISTKTPEIQAKIKYKFIK